ncbi:hypothetical protein [Peribacillus acanthi]|uniref:hypothetical protein n=1 Tax=Peribacillus acanthi TaxID=2171554 RepID=UPI000D3E5C3B|nr:hypothetical protein [Peribacillus acanthi]
MIKKALSMMFAFLLMFSSVGFAQVQGEPTQNPASASASYYYWKITSTSNYGNVTKGSWVHLYTGYPATRTGEVDTISASVTYTHQIAGTVNVTNSVVSAEVGYTIGQDKQFSISRETPPLNKGEYVKAFYIKSYSRTTLNQRQYFYDLGTSYPTSNYATGYADEAILPQLRLEYYSSTARSAGPTKVEYYENIDGEYVQVNEEELGENVE